VLPNTLHKSPLAICLVAALAIVAPATAATIDPDDAEKVIDHAPLRTAHLQVKINPGEVVRWRSPRIGQVERLSIAIGGREAFYQPEPRTRNCVAYAYEAGVAIRLTDCRNGRRVPYVRVRAVSAALKPAAISLRVYSTH
jgi:hypothetical protein